MRLFLLLISVLFYSGSISAQSWADSAATWHYTLSNFYIEGYTSIEYVGDTIIQNEEAEKLAVHRAGINHISGETFYSFSHYEYTRSDSDKVYHLINNEFKILYDFSAAVGDTLTHYISPQYQVLPSECDTISKSVVSEIGTDTINGVVLRWYEVEYITEMEAFLGRIYEKLGGDFMFPQSATCGLDFEFYHTLRCYSDFNFEYFNPLFLQDCDFIYEWPQVNYFVNNPEWCVSQSYSFGENCVHNEEIVHYVDSIVIIDSLQYYEIRSKGIHWDVAGIDGGECEHDEAFVDYHQAYLRQEGKSIYLYDEEEQEEFKIYDFDLSIGDTLDHLEFPIASLNWSGEVFPQEFDPFVITYIDSIFLNYNYYKRFYFDTPELTDPINELDTSMFFIEGIGHPLGFLYSYEDFFEYMHYLHSFRVAEFHYFDFPQIDNAPSCSFSVNIVELSLSIDLKIYPNPSHGAVRIELNKNISKAELRILNSMGQEVLYKQVSTSSFLLDLDEMTSGLYFIQIKSEEGVYITERLILE